MIETKDTSNRVQRALLVSAWDDECPEVDARSLLEELEELVATLGIPILGRLLLRNRETQARFLLGTGKADEVVAKAKELDADVIIFDNELSPSQQRNWEKLAGIAVIDRHEVILDIFAQRAQTREARLQIELARAEYSLPRLTRAWTHLVRQGGGIGARGEGETQLEQDKRRIRGNIDRLKAELAHVRKSRATQRKDRKRAPVPNVAIVGYTNVGKSSLLRRLTGADVFVEDKLFATLDTTTRRIDLPNNQPLLLTDTVGFVRRLPHELVESFNATLEESVMAEFLIHVLDASQPRVLEFYETTKNVLEELGAGDKESIIVFNKVDKVEDVSLLAGLRLRFPEAHFVSVHSGAGLEELVAHLAEKTAAIFRGGVKEFRFHAQHGAELARLHRQAKVLSIEYVGDEVRVVAQVSERLAEEWAEFLVDHDEKRAGESGKTVDAQNACAH